MVMGSKACNKCKIEKPLSEFTKRKDSKDGLDYRCVECKKEYREQNKEKISQKKKEWWAKNKENKLEKNKEYNREYRSRNREELNAKRRKVDCERKRYYRKNIITSDEERRERRRKYIAKYKSTDKFKEARKRYKSSEKGRLANYRYGVKRRSYKYNVAFTQHERREILDRDNWTCQFCNVKVHDENINNELKAHIDHIIPISKGGNSKPTNLQVLCRTCNLKKSNKIIIKDFV